MPERTASTPGRQPSPLGAELVAARKKAKLTVEQVSAVTKIRPGLIREIEDGDFRSCGGAIYARGHLRAIATAVRIDPTPIIAAFDAKHGVPEERPVPEKLLASDPVALREFRERRGTQWMVPMVVAAATLTIIAAISLISTSKPAGGAHPQAQDKTVTELSSVVPSPQPQASQPSDLLAFAGVNVHVVIKQQPSWVHVEDAKQRVLFEGVLKPGDTKDFRSTGALKVILGNAGAVDLTVNGRHLGAPDDFGKVFRTTFSPGDPALGSNG